MKVGHSWRKAIHLDPCGGPVDELGSGRRGSVDSGFWEVVDNGSGGSTIRYELRYLPGGYAPPFMVRWFLGSGMQVFVGQLRSYAEKHAG